MKSTPLLWAVLWLSAFSPLTGLGQCAGGTAPMTITYDTIVYGNGNSSRSFSFPKFDPSVGTLLSADVSSVVGLQYSYTLENQTGLARLFKTKIVRTDDISSNVLDPETISSVNQTPYVSNTISGLQALNYGPANMSYSLFNSITDARLVNFMGAGNVDFDYETGTSASVQGPLPWQLNFTSVADTTHFSVTYRYCTTTLLSANLLIFSLNPQKDRIILQWQQANVEAGRRYDVQMSKDGRVFNTVGSVMENSSGMYSYTWMGNANGTVYFRLQQNNVSGEIKYSYIRQATMLSKTESGIRVFPTLFTGGQLQVQVPERGDWLVNMYSMDGRRVMSSVMHDSYTGYIDVPANAGNGMYTTEIINTHTSVRQVTKLIIQR